MENFDLTVTWHMWVTLAFITGAVILYCTEKYSIEAISGGIVAFLLVFFHFFKPEGATGLDPTNILAGFADPALMTILALLIIGQGMFHTGALEGITQRLGGSMDVRPRATLVGVFAMAFIVSAFMNNTPVVVMFLPILSALALKTQGASKVMMPLSFVCILAGMTTLIGSSTNLLVAGELAQMTNPVTHPEVCQRLGESDIGCPIKLEFFDLTRMGLILAAAGLLYLVIFAPLLLPKRPDMQQIISSEGKQYIAQIKISENHPLKGKEPIAGLFPDLHKFTVRMIQRGDQTLLPPFDEALEEDDILIVAATRPALSNLLSSHPEYLKGMLRIAGFQQDDDTNRSGESLMISEAIVAPGSRMVGRNIEQLGFRRSTGCLVLGIQRRSRMIRKRMLEIRLEPGDILLIFGYGPQMESLKSNRDLIILESATKELPDIRRAIMARIIFGLVILAAATGVVEIVHAAIAGALGMVAAGCLNIRQAGRAIDRRIYMLIGAAFAMGTAMEQTGAAQYLAVQVVNIFQPFGTLALLAALFLLIAILTNLLSNAATAILFAPIAVNVAYQIGVDPTILIMTVIFAANCSFATPIAYQTNLLVMGPGHYSFRDFLKFGTPLVLVIWLTFIAVAPFMFNL